MYGVDKLACLFVKSACDERHQCSIFFMVHLIVKIPTGLIISCNSWTRKCWKSRLAHFFNCFFHTEHFKSSYVNQHMVVIELSNCHLSIKLLFAPCACRCTVFGWKSRFSAVFCVRPWLISLLVSCKLLSVQVDITLCMFCCGLLEIFSCVVSDPIDRMYSLAYERVCLLHGHVVIFGWSAADVELLRPASCSESTKSYF